jgi:hypothetical protein
MLSARNAPHVSAAFPLHGMLQDDAAIVAEGTLAGVPAQQSSPYSTPNTE